MYVCICNAISEAQAKEAAQKYLNIDNYFTSNNMSYNCSACRRSMETIFEKEKALKLYAKSVEA